MKKLTIVLFFLLTNIACQPIEKIEEVTFDNNQLSGSMVIGNGLLMQGFTLST